jgi:hypothetical protein
MPLRCPSYLSLKLHNQVNPEGWKGRETGFPDVDINSSVGPTKWVLQSGSYKVGPTKWALQSGSYKVGPTKWVLQSGSYKVGPTKWVLQSGSYKVDLTKWVLQSGSYKVGPTKWVLQSGSYKVGPTKWVLQRGSYKVDPKIRKGREPRHWSGLTTKRSKEKGVGSFGASASCQLTGCQMSKYPTR